MIRGERGQHMGAETQEPMRVLIFHIRVSMGHERAAQALAAAFKTRRQDKVDVRLVEALGYSSGWLAPVVCRSYMSIVKFVPALWDFLYDDPHAEGAADRLLRYWTWRSRKNFLDLMAEFRPHLVVCTQALPARILATLKKWGDAQAPGMGAPIFAVVTDFGIHRYWADDRIDGYFVPGVDESRKLVSMGVRPDKIVSTGIPIPPKIADPLSEIDLLRAKESFGLRDGRPTVLLMGGSRGIGLKSDLMEELEHLPFEINILASAGTNPDALQAFRGWSTRSKHRVVPLEYRPDIRLLYGLSDVAITKPGGLTLAECMAVGLPMIVQHALPGQERHNLEFVRKADLAEFGSDSPDVVARLRELLLDPARRARLRLQLKSVARPDAAFSIVDYLLQRISTPSERFARPLFCPTAGH